MSTDKEYVQNLARAVIENREQVDDVKEGEKSLLAAAKDKGIHIAAFKSALKLKKLGEGERADFLRAFGNYVTDLGLDAQGDLFDQPREAKAAPAPVEKPAASSSDMSMGLGSAADAPGSYRVKH